MKATTILIVEDEAIVVADLAGKLGRLGYQVAGSAAQGEEAVALACRLQPNLVLMDICLDGPMDGIEAAEAIRCQYDVPVPMRLSLPIDCKSCIRRLAKMGERTGSQPRRTNENQGGYQQSARITRQKTISMKTPDTTRRWIRNAADERAVATGCRFDLERACWTVYWIETFCRLYEGEYAGSPLLLRGAHSMPLTSVEEPWDAGGKEKSIRRALDFLNCVEAKEPLDWQYECIMRIFGWVKHSERWDREVRRFRKGSLWVPKKNKKSPTLAAIGLYLLAGDGEQGQKVFFAAKDGTQAREIAGQHALEMVRSSPELSAACEINLSRMRISHTKTRSYLQPLSSGDSRTQESKEGINGSCLIDETHVVDREFISRINRAGISRSEPLFLQFSTSGKDPDSYGKEEFDYGRDVTAGTIEDSTYFFAHYGAKADLTDEDLAKNPAEIIATANPALGHTVDLDEALSDYQTSRVSIRRLADFKTYRLNLWQRSASPWIRIDDWDKCGRDFTADDLLGQSCGAGFDIGKTDDMSALALVFPENADSWSETAEEVVRQRKPFEETNTIDQYGNSLKELLVQMEQPVKILTFYWLPEAAVERYGHEVDYAQWVRSGHLKLTRGNTINPSEIIADLRDIMRKYRVEKFAYDPWYASLIIEALQKEDGFPEEAAWQFAQSIKFFAWPSSLFERLVISGKLHHDRNPITAWEAGHVQVKIDNNDNMRPVKPQRQTRKKIDGIVATIMALDATTRMIDTRSAYEDRGALTVNDILGENPEECEEEYYEGEPEEDYLGDPLGSFYR